METVVYNTPKRPSDAPLQNSNFYDVPSGFKNLPLKICGRRRVAATRHRMICFVLLQKVVKKFIPALFSSVLFSKS